MSLEKLIRDTDAPYFLQNVRKFLSKTVSAYTLALALTSGCGGSESNVFTPIGDEIGGGVPIAPTPTEQDNTGRVTAPAKGKILFRALDEVEGLYVMDSNGNNRTLLREGGDYPKWSPDGKYISFNEGMLVRNNTDSIGIMKSDGSEERIFENFYSYSWSPDGSRIGLYSAPHSPLGETFLITNPDGSEETQLSSSEGNPATGYNTYKFSPDGSTLSFTGYDKDSETFGLFLINIDGTERRKLVDNFQFGNTPVVPWWWPDGSKIIFEGRDRSVENWEDTPFEQYVINKDGSGLKKWMKWESTKRMKSWESRDWSPDGKYISFSDIIGFDEFAGHMSDVYVMNSDESELRNLTEAIRQTRIAEGYAVSYHFSGWSPDSSTIVLDENVRLEQHFMRNIYFVNPDGSELRNMTNTKLDEDIYFHGESGSDREWSPDSTKMAALAMVPQRRDNKYLDFVKLLILSKDGSPIHDITPAYLMTTPHGSSYGGIWHMDWSPD